MDSHPPLSERIAADVLAATSRDVSPRVLRLARDVCISSVGAMLAGARMEVAAQVADYVRASRVPGESTVIGHGWRTSAELAALANCSAAHNTELEDVAFPEAAYTCHLVPALLALAEELHVSGAEFLLALVVGYELTARPAMDGRAMALGWQPGSQFGTLGVAAAAARLMRLDERQTRDAITLAASFSSGLIAQVGSAGHIIEAGTAGRNGLMAAQLASRGLGGHPTVLEGAGGYFETLMQAPAAMPAFGRADDWRIGQVSFKVYPCCYFLQRVIEGMREMVHAHSIAAGDVEGVTVTGNAQFARFLDIPQPRDGEHARFSLHHAIASALAGEDMLFDTFTTASVNAPGRAALRARVTLLNDGSAGSALAAPNELTVHLRDGRVLRAHCLAHRGDRSRPLEDADVEARFHACASHVPEAVRSRVLQSLLALPGLDDVAVLPRALSAAA